ncbi:histidine phosphatase family protein [Pseudomonas akapageensis]|uniref:lipopolysaccharide core heptose(II)-phosphate phosphatase PmrG n=1 Tax=Pseudomonas akapageensis TaxID=2609961 RepID=UPI001409C6E5|nr:histidine phosphatase family protein [Pseudomonas akapageensis]
MNSNKNHTRHSRPTFSRAISRSKLCAALLLAVLVPAWLLAESFGTPMAADLNRSSPAQVSALVSDWHRGNVIVLVRHLERCSRVDAPCLDGRAGITARSTAIGEYMGKEFRQLGLSNSDIYNSPLKRTAQTAQVMFNQTTAKQDWLYQCNGTFMGEALQRKVPGRNLILVTHSSCIDEFEASLGLSESDPDYGGALFISTSDDKTQNKVLGFIDADDWDDVFGA